MTPDDLLFESPAAPFVATARRIVRRNRENVRRSFPVHLARHEALLNALYSFECEHVWTFHLTRRSPTPLEQLVFSASHKNLIALFGILENVQSGLLGSARPLFRQVLEGQLLAKYAAVVYDVELAERWSRRESLSVPKVVLAKLHSTQSAVLRQFWQSSHVYVHSSTGSQQVSMNAEANMALIAHDLTVMGMLLHSQVHVTTQHTFTRAERRLVARHDEEGRVSDLLTEMRNNLSVDLKEHGPDVRAFIRTFRSRWRGSDGNHLSERRKEP